MMDITELSLRQVIDELETGRARVEDAIELALSRLKDAIAAPVLCQKCAAVATMDAELASMLVCLPPGLAIIVRALNGRGTVGGQTLADAVFKHVSPSQRPRKERAALNSAVRRGRKHLRQFG